MTRARLYPLAIAVLLATGLPGLAWVYGVDPREPVPMVGLGLAYVVTLAWLGIIADGVWRIVRQLCPVPA